MLSLKSTNLKASERRKKRYKKTTEPVNPRNRLIIILCSFFVLGFTYVAVLVDLQTISSEKYQNIGLSQRTTRTQINAERGSIVDRQGFILASSIPTHQIVADPQTIQNYTKTAGVLAGVLDVDAAELEVKLRGEGPNDRYQLISRGLEKNTMDQIESLRKTNKNDLMGIYLLPEEKRFYPAENLALSLVGRVDPYENGVYGIENQYNDIMTGMAGEKQFEKNNFGGSIGFGSSVLKPAKEGFDVVLTIDNRLQFVAEKTLIKHCESQQANGASAVISNPSNGEILAIASVSKNNSGKCEVAKYNKAIVDSYEPGSVIKPFVIAEYIEKFDKSADAKIYVPESITLGGKKFVDEHPHEAEPFNLKEIMAQSMNTGVISISQKLGDDSTYNAISKFGFGSYSDLGLQGESQGSLRQVNDWWGSDSGSIPIGQGMTTNLVQINSAYNTIANKGVYVQPKIVSSLKSPEGENLLPEPKPLNRVISEKSAEETTKTLVEVVETGTAKSAKVEGFTIAGKTGTAWKAYENEDGEYSYGAPGSRKYVVTFSGFIVSENPNLSISVMVDEPKVGESSSMVAVPLFSDLRVYAQNILDTTDAAGNLDSNGKVRARPAENIESNDDILTIASGSELGVTDEQ